MPSIPPLYKRRRATLHHRKVMGYLTNRELTGACDSFLFLFEF